MSDGWQDIRHRSLINFLVINPSGTVFWKCVDASEHVKDAKLLFRLLDEVVEEVGEELVVQVITDNASNYRATGQMLMEKRKHLYWTPCAAHCLDLMREKIGELPQHKNALIKAKKVSNYIYNHSLVLSLMRQFTNRELIRPATTRFAIAYLTLQSIYQVRQPLEGMFTSEKWTNSNYANKADGKEIRRIILRDNNFWPSLIYAIKTTKPLVEVLRLVDGEKEPAMGFLYNVMDEAKEKIAKNLGGEEKDYKEIWDLIDKKWEIQMHRDLHAAAYFLNPRCHYAPGFSTHVEIKRGLLDCLAKLIPNIDEMEKADVQCSAFHAQQGFFGLTQAKNTLYKRSPVEWWTQYGDGTPELQKFAIKVLGLTCSSSGCERNWSAFNQVQTKRRNRLTTARMNALVYILYNKKLKDRHLKLKSLGNDEDNLLIDELPSDDEWLVGEDEYGPNISLDDINVDVFEGEGPSQATQAQPIESSSKNSKKASAQGSNKGKGKMRLINEDEEDWEDFDEDSDNGNDEDIDNDSLDEFIL
ncbi:PREDICTED: uncharacterized protein LOC109157329 [Ipomoea nil]|uniref:uncharacterized protein LOC109157329 n=1 Tax=Ipomoea nil TaxID=35883 RepID=UPI000900E1E9|nr:PREDICTED: uncharacterized protein LOC109157329 [Ipomoea nil]